MERLAGPLAKLEGEGDYSLTPHVREAVGLIEAARANGLTLEDYLLQSGLFTSQGYSPEAQAIAQGLSHAKATDLSAPRLLAVHSVRHCRRTAARGGNQK